MNEKTITPKEQSKNLLTQLIHTYPAAFFPFGERKVKPLKLGIHKDLAPLVKEWGYQPAALKIVLSTYTRAMRYQVALTKETHRIDLQGEPAGEITDANRQTARAQLDQIKEKRRSETAARGGQPGRPSKKPGTADKGVSQNALAALQKKFGG